MKRKVFVILVMVGCISVLNAETPDLEQELHIENQENQLQDNLIQSRMLANKAKREGIATIKSLKADLTFIQKLESDPKFRNCIVLKANLKKLDSLAIRAKRLLDRRKATKEDYQDYMDELNSEKANLKNKIDSIQCSKER